MLLSTVHRIKGKEWGHVIVFGASAGLFPHRLSDDEEGERRVFHVALTRARSQVVVLADAEAPSPFVGELDGSRPHQALTRRAAPEPGRAGGRSASPTSKRRQPELPTVAAVGGLALEYRGQTGTILEVDAHGVIVAVGESRSEVPFGTDVRVEGRTVTLVAEPSAESAAAEQALRQWRSAVARQDAVPAYVVLTDKDLVGIATALPAYVGRAGRVSGHRTAPTRALGRRDPVRARSRWGRAG